MEELERLEEIKCRIHHQDRCIDLNKEMIAQTNGNFPKQTERWQRNIWAGERAIQRYKNIFNQELDKLRYKGE